MTGDSMSDSVRDVGVGELRRPRLVAAALEIGAVLLALVALAWAITRFWTLTQAADPVGPGIAETLFRLLIAGALALLLAGLAELLRVWDRLPAAPAAPRAGVNEDDIVRRLTAALSTSRATGGARAESTPLLQSEALALLREIRDLTLLAPEQRARRYEIQAAAAVEQLTNEIPQLLREHDWVQAQQRLRVARGRFPTAPQWDALAAQVEQARATVESHDIESATRQLNDLMNLRAWDRVVETVRDLLQRHPGSPGAEELARRVMRGRAKALADARARLMAQAQAAAHERDWSTALRLANAMIERHPQSAEAEALRQQLPTLQDNAEIQARQQMEAQIREHIKEHRFVDALETARALIERYPQSPQAAVLREQLPRMEQRAAEQARQTI